MLTRMNTGAGGDSEWFDKNHYLTLEDNVGLQSFTNGQSVSLPLNRPVIFNCKDYTQCLVGSSGITAVSMGIKSDLSVVDISSEVSNRTVNVTNYDYIMILRTVGATSQAITFS